MITLPFPPATLNPNKRPHWAERARVFKQYKFQCFALLSQFRSELQGRAVFSIEFRPPDSRRRDADNLLAASKAMIDALSDITGIDDSEFAYSIAMGAPVKGGSVVVSVDAEQARAA